MDFGTWIKSVREAEAISLREFSRQINVEFSTLQRIEAGQVEASIRSAFHVCRGLGISLEKMIAELTGDSATTESVPSVEPTSTKFEAILTPDTVQAIVRTDANAENIARLMLGFVIERTKSDIQAGLAGENSLRYFGEVPFFGMPIFGVSLRYPAQIGIENILGFSRGGGAVSLMEIGTVIRHRRKIEIDHIKPLSQLGSLTSHNISVSASNLSRIETGAVANIKLRDALVLDQAFSHGHDILKMYWNAPELEDRRTAMPMFPGLWMPLDVDCFIILGRWLWLIYGDDHSWLENIHAALKPFQNGG